MISKKYIAFLIVPIIGFAIGTATLFTHAGNVSAATKSDVSNKKQILQEKKLTRKARVKSVRSYRKSRVVRHQIKHVVVAMPTATAAPISAASTVSQPVVPVKPVSQSVAQPATSEIAKIISLINAERQKNGLGAVKENTLLDQGAAIKAKDMADQNYFAHTNPQGKTDFGFFDQVGYKYLAAGSNLAEGDFGSSEGLVSAWMNSPGHRVNILADFGQEIGIGVYGKYYVMFIAKPM